MIRRVHNAFGSRFCHFFVTAILSGTLGLTVSAADSSQLPAPANRKVDFGQDIQPILAKNCYECHGGEKQKGGLRLDQKEAALKGGDTGPLLVAGKSAESLLIQVVTGAKEDIARMPKKREPLSDEQIGILRGWIDQGADWPETGVTK